MKTIRRIWKWYIANATSRHVWRVTYKDGRRTRLLPFSEAKGLGECFNGDIWIDYEKGYF